MLSEGVLLHVAIMLHVMAFVVWVGGMFFAHMALRPAAQSVLEAPQRLKLLSKVFSRFFPWIWIVVILLPLTGYWMIFQYGGFAMVARYVHVMAGIGDLMILIFAVIYFIPYRKLRQTVEAEDFPSAAGHLAVIRKLILTNLCLGLVTIAVATLGRIFI